VAVGFPRPGRPPFGSYGPWLTFQQLDIERDPAGQGFAAGTFDLVIAANVLHATRDLAETLRHVAWLVAPTGRLVVSETTAFSIFATLTFRNEDQSVICPMLATEWKVQDRRWELKLRPNVRFHNGDLLTSEDVRFSVEAAGRYG